MRTRFGQWLEQHGESPCGFAERRGYNVGSVRRLLGIGRAPFAIQKWREEFLLVISGETGIPLGRLKRDAIKAAQDPVPPRAWRRRTQEDTDGKEAAE